MPGARVTDALFLKNNFIGLGWSKADREAFKAAVAATFPDKKAGAIPNNAGQLFRFVGLMVSLLSHAPYSGNERA